MHADPVFVDGTGRRRRLFALAGAAAGVLLALAALVLVAGFTGTGPGHLPTLPLPAGGDAREAVSPPRPSGTPTTPAQAPRPGLPIPSTVESPSVAAVTPSPSRSNHRRVPTHTPGNKPSKKA
ncbi:hypothetical protein [Phytohabitans rumicis]|uniref:hypothetical protein n=1 Tax=Phytohabitans rumicis TaxID=1076125 RepID=UPI0015660F67|nr:hypothetical protein [Phytohabitans rumicis]